jgi:hypothetical protein
VVSDRYQPGSFWVEHRFSDAATISPRPCEKTQQPLMWGRVSDPSRPSESSAAFGEGTGFSRAAKVLFVYSPERAPAREEFRLNSPGICTRLDETETLDVTNEHHLENREGSRPVS